MSEKSTLEMKNEAEEFYREAFCAESATVLPPSAVSEFIITGVVKIIRNGEPMFVAAVEPS